MITVEQAISQMSADEKDELKGRIIRIEERIKYIADNIKNTDYVTQAEFRPIKNEHVTRAEFKPVRSIVYGLVGLILVAVFTALVAGVIRQ